MRSKIIWLMLTLGAVLALALFLPAVTYAGQIVPGHFAVASADWAPVPATLAIHGGGGRHGGGGWHRRLAQRRPLLWRRILLAVL
jgi:hypothetical protein